jgi:hypothetical protein
LSAAVPSQGSPRSFRFQRNSLAMTVFIYFF